MLDQLSPRYENFVIVGDLNSEETNCEISNFMDVYGLRNLIKSPTCYKSADSPTSIDMFLTNKTSGFQNTTTMEVGLSDFHLMILTVLKSGLLKKVQELLHTETTLSLILLSFVMTLNAT